MPREFNVLALVKGTEHHIYIYDDDSLSRLIDTLRNHAADATCSLNWFDASVLTQKAREQAKQRPATTRSVRSRI